ncbi:hypothetical protein [Paludifilum halophilum]|uniref:Uncharacterized protein n=1 Tax=Paludifilum halophilum TaxID=1642702 RepID=A0A235B3K4_9BACL|nr:hypothetical protein [Paludifilum halophilum]OYD06864.1 hypothetical protein CHM34_13035 [Paludifilum halophilum]
MGEERCRTDDRIPVTVLSGYLGAGRKLEDALDDDKNAASSAVFLSVCLSVVGTFLPSLHIIPFNISGCFLMDERKPDGVLQ